MVSNLEDSCWSLPPISICKTHPRYILQVLGQKKKNLGGLSTATAGLHQGFVFAADVIQVFL